MNKFLTNSKPLTPKRTNTRKNAENSQNVENMQEDIGIMKQKKVKLEEKSTTELLYGAFHEDNAEYVHRVLSKNRPFDLTMNKTMTKIEFCENFSDPSTHFMLLSVDESIVEKISEGQTLTIRGQTNDDTVVCTDERTYPLKIVESATTCLIFQKMLEPPKSEENPKFEVIIIDGKCYALAELCPPIDILNISHLKDLLHETEVLWSEQEVNDSKGKSMSDLLKTVQMSEKEILMAIEDLPVVKFESGKYRYLSHGYRAELFGRIVELIDDDSIEGVSMEKVTFDGLCKCFNEKVPNEVIDWYLGTKCEKIGDSEEYFIKKDELVKDMAVVVLHSTQKMQMEQFREVLAKILPFGIEFNDSHLEGIAEVSETAHGKFLVYLSKEDLPDDIRERMVYLFNHRKLWTMDQLRPYFGDLVKSKVAFDKYLVQKCEYTLSANNEILYCGVKN